MAPEFLPGEITADTTLVRTHDDVRVLLTYALPGARVALYPIAGGAREELDALAASARWVVSLDRLGGAVQSVDAYHLPCDAAGMIRRAREVVEGALAEARGVTWEQRVEEGKRQALAGLRVTAG